MIPGCQLSADFGRRGYTPESIRRFIDLIGYTKVEAINDVSLLEHAVREDLNLKAPRVFGVLNPLKGYNLKLSVG